MRINLKNFRQSHGLFQSEMAEILGINQSNVSRAEIRGGFDLTYNQIQTLYERFGQEDVDSFAIPESRLIDASNNTNVDGTQNNGVFGTDPTSLEIIKQLKSDFQTHKRCVIFRKTFTSKICFFGFCSVSLQCVHQQIFNTLANRESPSPSRRLFLFAIRRNISLQPCNLSTTRR